MTDYDSNRYDDAVPLDETEHDVPATTRRNVARLLGVIGGGAAIGSVAVNYLTGLADAGLATGGDSLTYENVYVEGTHLVDTDGKRITADQLAKGSGKSITVLPEKKGGGALEKKKATTVLVRFGPDDFEEPTELDWTADGYVAYSMVCTHEGCLVSGRAGDDLYCPCHGTSYDPLEGATVVGGPAPEPLPQLPIGISDDGTLLLATGPFEGPIGASHD
ncbi:MAG: ubiquinol-cytochrome c reductase iron-sulfur subunit [Haloplanus sp.]